MKVLIFSILFVSCSAVGSPYWPPTTTHSTTMSSFKLNSSRFIPSSLRYNLVWSDQLIPSYISSSQLSFAANHMVGTQKIWKYQADQFRSINPNWLVVGYHLALGLNPPNNTEVASTYSSGFIGVVSPDGYVDEWSHHFIPWCQSHSLSKTAIENMFQHWNLNSKSNRVWNMDPYWLMNSTNSEWQEYLGDEMVTWMNKMDDDGIFFDVAVETYGWRYRPNVDYDGYYWWKSPNFPIGPYSALTTLSEFAAWQNSQYLQLYSEIYKRFHTTTMDRLVIPNVDQMITSWYDPIWLEGTTPEGETVDGAMSEGFGNANSGDMYLTLQRVIKHLTGRGKILICQFSANSDSDRLRRVAMYMLVKNDVSFINALCGSYVCWFPEYEIDIGDQSAVPTDISSIRISGSGSASLFKRAYSNGFVLCNTATSSINYNISKAKKYAFVSTSGGGSIGSNGLMPSSMTLEYNEVTSDSISIPSSGCVIFKDMTSITSSEQQQQNHNPSGSGGNTQTSNSHIYSSSPFLLLVLFFFIQ